MVLPITSEPIPLLTDSDGVVRVSGTRVTLDIVIATFKTGATAEEIVQQFPVLPLADVYAVISYYLKRQDEVEAYLLQRKKLAEKMRQENEKRFDLRGIRERLLARHRQKGG